MKKIATFLAMAVVAISLSSCDLFGGNEPKPNKNFKQLPFSVSAKKKVYFSQGNLQYNAQKDVFRFAAKQTDFIGSDNKKIAADYAGWIDLFIWMSGACPTSLELEALPADWGENKIGKDPENTWFTLSNDEWYYLLFERENAANLLACATVCGIKGLLLLPDGWERPTSVSFASMDDLYVATESVLGKYHFTEANGFSRNRYEAEGWATLEKSGAVFLPAAGTRIGTQCYDCGAGGRYWSGKVGLGGMAYGIGFSDKMIDGKLQEDAKEGLSVRLVKSAN